MLEEIQKTWWEKNGRFNDNLYKAYLRAKLKEEERKAEKQLFVYTWDSPLYTLTRNYLVGSK